MKRRVVGLSAVSVFCTSVFPAREPKNVKPVVVSWPVKISAHHLDESPGDISSAACASTQPAHPDTTSHLEVTKNERLYRFMFPKILQRTVYVSYTAYGSHIGEMELGG
jgi:hypothetical protein